MAVQARLLRRETCAPRRGLRHRSPGQHGPDPLRDRAADLQRAVLDQFARDRLDQLPVPIDHSLRLGAATALIGKHVDHREVVGRCQGRAGLGARRPALAPRSAGLVFR
jgi:hypothetical protein